MLPSKPMYLITAKTRVVARCENDVLLYVAAAQQELYIANMSLPIYLPRYMPRNRMGLILCQIDFSRKM